MTQQSEMYDVTELVQDKPSRSYENTYGQYIDFFRMLGTSEKKIVVTCAPQCWCPLILYLGHGVHQPKHVPGIDIEESVPWTVLLAAEQDTRRIVEIASAVRPELVHALYLVDTEWPCPFKQHKSMISFNVTSNASFFRPEVREYQRMLQAYQPDNGRCVIVPCAADKPYPSPLHKEVIKRLPEGWDVIVVTGVLGLIPQALWFEAPVYDAGLPNLRRVEETVEWYFSKHRKIYDRIVVYTDFCAHAVSEGLRRSSFTGEVEFLFGTYWRDSYENTMLLEHLNRLEATVCKD